MLFDFIYWNGADSLADAKYLARLTKPSPGRNKARMTFVGTAAFLASSKVVRFRVRSPPPTGTTTNGAPARPRRQHPEPTPIGGLGFTREMYAPRWV